MKLEQEERANRSSQLEDANEHESEMEGERKERGHIFGSPSSFKLRPKEFRRIWLTSSSWRPDEPGGNGIGLTGELEHVGATPPLLDFLSQLLVVTLSST